MKRSAILICGILFITNTAMAAAAGSTEEQLKQLEQRTAKAAKAADAGLEEYARDRFDSVRSSIAAARAAALLGIPPTTEIPIPLEPAPAQIIP